MAVETFTWSPRLDPEGTATYRTRTSQFGDGYAQVVGDGLNNKSQSWPLTFKGGRATIVAIRDFLDRHAGYRSFLWTPPLGAVGFYKASEYRLAAHGAEIYTLTVTFEQAFHP
ncbi:phage tail protein [Pseudomonas oryzihabitans]|uniref:Phage-related protein n=1 Tax=Pseudomonas oryzihabitans TaxID=47885 RepID=A0A1G5MUV1_9PSED|nr:phage tail protein [Pseudomonas psychrotolerans]NMY89829.1 phage tail protein [Pseudomonas psychrotolerans]SCZ28832.1 Phage-related protein [Pseudomonas psychrotolerans]